MILLYSFLNFVIVYIKTFVFRKSKKYIQQTVTLQCGHTLYLSKIFAHELSAKLKFWWFASLEISGVC